MTPAVWTEARKAKLAALWAKGLSAREIGDILACSRSAVLGAVHRMDLPSRTPSKPAMRPNPRKVRRPRRVRFAGAPGLEATELVELPVEPGRVRFLDRGDRDCAWPAGGAPGPAMLCCGLPIIRADHEAGWRYCAQHIARARGDRLKGSDAAPPRSKPVAAVADNDDAKPTELARDLASQALMAVE